MRKQLEADDEDLGNLLKPDNVETRCKMNVGLLEMTSHWERDSSSGSCQLL